MLSILAVDLFHTEPCLKREEFPPLGTPEANPRGHRTCCLKFPGQTWQCELSSVIQASQPLDWTCPVV